MSTRRPLTDGVHSSRSGERTPLRSVENEPMHLLTPSSRLKSRSASNSNKTPKTEGPATFCLPAPISPAPPPSEVICGQTPETRGMASAIVDASTGAATALGGITFKSFICAGGEVVLSDPSVVLEDSLLLPRDQSIEGLPLPGDGENSCPTFLSDSMVTQCCDDHTDHPYCDPGSDVASPEADRSSSCELSRPSVNIEAGGAIIIHDIDESVNPRDITFKSFVCAGGEVELPDASKLSDDAIPLSDDRSLPPNGESTYPSIVVDECDPRLSDVHADHPYCNAESDAASVNADLSSFKETSVNSASALETSETAPATEQSAGNQEAASGRSDVTFGSFVRSGGEVEVSDSPRLAERTIPLPGDQLASSRSQYDASLNPSVIYDNQSSDHAEHPYCHAESGVNEPSGRVSASGKSVKVLEQVTCQLFQESTNREEGASRSIPECTERECAHAGDGAVPSMLRESESSDGKDAGASARSSTPVVDEQESSSAEPRSQRDAAADSGEARDCALGSSGSGPLPSESAEEPSTENLLDVLTELPGFSFVADTLPFELLSPVLRATPVNRKRYARASFRALAPAPAENAALEAEKVLLNLAEGSFIVPGDPDSLWATVALESPALRPLFNSTALGAASTRRPPQAPNKEDGVENRADSVVEKEEEEGEVPHGVAEPPLSPVEEATEEVEERVDQAPAEAPEEKTELKASPLVSPPPPPPPPLSQAERLPRRFSLLPGEHLQQQLFQMAQLLIQASAKVGTAPPFTRPAPPAAARAVECESACVGTSPVALADRSANTSGAFERKREFAVSDACTATDSLLWNLSPGSLAGLPRDELEQHLTSSQIMVEALVQQLASARGPACHPGGPAPSDLRDKLVQTDHTELNQTITYKELYVAALDRIRELELGQSALQNLLDGMQDARTSMSALCSDTEAALCSMNQISDLVRDDHQSLRTQYGQMRSLYEKCRASQTRLVQKVRDTLQQREDMRGQVEEAVSHKQAAFSVTEQLRVHCAERISELEESVGSHQELMAALTKTYPQQVALNKAYVESINSSTELLQRTLSDQAALHQELQSARRLLQRTTPLLGRLNQKAAAALAERDQQRLERDQALEEREQIQEELDLTASSLQGATQQIGDLNLQFTIMSSEMGVLRQKLSEEEEDRAGLERKVTELSATVSSSLASYTFLEQALAAETSKLQQSWQVAKQATDRANELEAVLVQSEQRVRDLDRALGLSEEQVGRLQAQSHSQDQRLQQLRSVQDDAKSMREMNEFLQMENEMAREQVMESEGTLRANLQGLRERNIQCEDLKRDLGQTCLEKQALQAELEVTQDKASRVQAELGQQLAQAATDVALLHHTLRGLTNHLHTALTAKKPVSSQDQAGGQQPSLQFERHPSSFVDCIMVALAGGRLEDNSSTEPPAGQDVSEPQPEGLGSESSAFTRIGPTTTPKRSRGATEDESNMGERDEEEECNVVEMLADLGNTVSELASALASLHQRRDTEHKALQNTICVLQGEQEVQLHRHTAEVSELRHQLTRLHTQVEKGTAALQNKAQDEKTMKQLFAEVTETREHLLKHKAENRELRKEVAELHHSVHQSQVEAQALREELSRAGSQSATTMHAMDDKIRLLKEVERLRKSLQEVEEGRAKLLERAKRHQGVHESNQRKMTKELHLLDEMIETVRKTLLSVPDVVKSCEELRRLSEYIG